LTTFVQANNIFTDNNNNNNNNNNNFTVS